MGHENGHTLQQTIRDHGVAKQQLKEDHAYLSSLWLTLRILSHQQLTGTYPWNGLRVRRRVAQSR